MKKSIIKRALCAVLCTVLATTLLFGSTPAIQSEAASRKPITGKITKAERVAVDKIKVTVKLNNKRAKVKYRDIKPSEIGKYFNGRVCIQYTFLKNNGRALFGDNNREVQGFKTAKIQNYKNGSFSVTIKDKRFQKMRGSKDYRVSVSCPEGSGLDIKNYKKVTYNKRKFKVVKKLVYKACESTELDGSCVTHCYACGKNFKTFQEFVDHTMKAFAELAEEYKDRDPMEFFNKVDSLRNSTKSCVDPKHIVMAVGTENKEAVYDYIWKKK